MATNLAQNTRIQSRLLKEFDCKLARDNADVFVVGGLEELAKDLFLVGGQEDIMVPGPCLKPGRCVSKRHW